MKRTLLAAAALLASLPYTAIAKPVDWTGWYWGANAGYVQTNAETARDISGTGYFFASSPGAIEANSFFELDKGGFTGGVQFGYNHKLGGVVIGAEGDINYTDATDFASATAGYPCCASTFTTTAEFDQTWLATLRAKVGVPVGSALLYATGGLAFGEVEIVQGFSDTDEPFAFSSQSKSATLTGWTAGGGIEFPIDDGIAMKIEYLYTDLGDINVGPTAFLVGYPNRLSEATADMTSQSIRIGVNWHY